MRVLPSIERLRELVDYNPETGEMFAKTGGGYRGCYKAGRKFSFIDHRGYVTGTLDGVRFYMHRVAYALGHGVEPSKYIDHINGNPSDNRLCNLRDVDGKLNSQNRRKAPSNNKSSGLLGVTYSPGENRFRAAIKPTHGKRIHLGCFGSAKEAHEAYLKAKRKLHEGCTI
jgi:hypothetical protein